LRTFFKSLKSHIFTSPIPIDRVFILLPAFVYLVQNNLLYVAGTHLDTAVYHVKLNNDHSNYSYSRPVTCFYVPFLTSRLLISSRSSQRQYSV
jgi:hypothetical protein